MSTLIGCAPALLGVLSLAVQIGFGVWFLLRPWPLRGPETDASSDEDRP